MNIDDFRRMQKRIQRAHAASQESNGEGFTQKLNSFSDEKITFVGLKSPEELEDDLLQLCVWIWSMKDYLKKLAIANGHAGQQIEDIVNANEALAIVADIANRDKHGTLTNSRTGDFAKLSDVKIQINQSAMEMPKFEGDEVTFDVTKPEDARLFATITFDDSSRSVMDAFVVISDAIGLWESQAYPLAGIGA